VLCACQHCYFRGSSRGIETKGSRVLVLEVLVKLSSKADCTYEYPSDLLVASAHQQWKTQALSTIHTSLHSMRPFYRNLGRLPLISDLGPSQIQRVAPRRCSFARIFHSTPPSLKVIPYILADIGEGRLVSYHINSH
jgi:hypothetical protein